MAATTSATTATPLGMDLLNAIERNAASNGSHAIRVALLGCGQGDSAPRVLVEMAKSAAAVGRRVAIIDLDLQRPRDLSALGCPRTDLSAFGANPDAPLPDGNPVWIGGEPGVALAPGQVPGRAVSQLLKRTAGAFDLVLVEGPALLNNNLGDMIIDGCDQTYLIVRQNTSTLYEVDHAIERVRRLGHEPSGLIFTDRSRSIPQFVYRLLFGGRRG